MRAAFVLALGIPLAACHVGPTAARHAGANTPGGATASAFVAYPPACPTCPDPLVGELLAVPDTGVLLLAAPRAVHFVHFSAIRRLSVEGLRNITRPGSEELRRLKHASRYPTGISPAVLRSLLTISAPDSVIVTR